MTDVWGYIIGAVVTAAGVLWGALSLRASGKRASDAEYAKKKLERKDAEFKATLNAVQEKQNVQKDNGSLTADERRNRLRNEYTDS